MEPPEVTVRTVPKLTEQVQGYDSMWQLWGTEQQTDRLMGRCRGCRKPREERDDVWEPVSNQSSPKEGPPSIFEFAAYQSLKKLLA